MLFLKGNNFNSIKYTGKALLPFRFPEHLSPSSWPPIPVQLNVQKTSFSQYNLYTTAQSSFLTSFTSIVTVGLTTLRKVE